MRMTRTGWLEAIPPVFSSRGVYLPGGIMAPWPNQIGTSMLGYGRRPRNQPLYRSTCSWNLLCRPVDGTR